MREPKQFCCEAFQPPELEIARSPAGRRVIKTARTVDAINAAARSGLRPLIKAVRAAPNIKCIVAVFQDPATGEIRLSTNLRFGPRGAKALDYTAYYPYYFPNPFAAYLVPPDITVGEEVWLEDLIEDLVAVWGNQGYSARLDAAAAVWNGSDFKITFDPKREAEFWLG
jgi:hypothetical protein